MHPVCLQLLISWGKRSESPDADKVKKDLRDVLFIGNPLLSDAGIA